MNTRVRVALVDDYEIVLKGLKELLDPERIEVIELDAMTSPSNPVDIALYDTFAQAQTDGDAVVELVRSPSVRKVVVFTWNSQQTLIDRARAVGVAGYLSKRLTGDVLSRQLQRINEEPGFVLELGEPDVPADQSGDWPGRHEGLTARESEMLALLCQGLTNEEIGKRAFLSVNSVKTYLRTAYRKMGVGRRSQAVAWGIDHGFTTRPKRTAQS